MTAYAACAAPMEVIVMAAFSPAGTSSNQAWALHSTTASHERVCSSRRPVDRFTEANRLSPHSAGGRTLM